jgi:hypothetical protein
MKNYLGSVISAAAKKQGRIPLVPLLASKKYRARKYIIFREACGHKQGRTPEDICWRKNTPLTCTRCYQKHAADARQGQGPKQMEAKKYAEEWARCYPDSSITDICRQFGFSPKLVANVLQEHGVKLLSAKEIKQRKYRKTLLSVEGHLHLVQPEQWDAQGRRLYECRGPSHYEPLRVWLKPGQHTACNRNCARQRHTFSDVDNFLRASGCSKVQWKRHGLYFRDSVASYVCPHKQLVEQRWRPLVRAVIHGETVCPHVDNFWTERVIRLFVRKAVLPRYAVAVGPISIKSRGGTFSFDIAVLRDGNPVAYIEPGSHQKAARYGGMSQRAANKSLLKIQQNDRRKKRWAAKRKILLLQVETGRKRLDLILVEVWDWLKRWHLARGTRPGVSYGDAVREVPYENDLRKAGLVPGSKRWQVLCLTCDWQFRYDRQVGRDPSDIHCPKCRGGVGKHGRTRKTIDARAEELGVKFKLPSGESFNEDRRGKSECVRCGESTTPSVADIFRSDWSKKCKRCAMSRKTA